MGGGRGADARLSSSSLSSCHDPARAQLARYGLSRLVIHAHKPLLLPLRPHAPPPLPPPLLPLPPHRSPLNAPPLHLALLRRPNPLVRPSPLLLLADLVHSIFEGSFLALSLPVSTRSVNASTGVFAELWKEYARADSRWGVADPTVVSLELLTVLGAGPLCCYCAWRLVERDRAVHYWL